MILREDRKSCEQFLEHGGAKQMVEYLSSSNEVYRVESLVVLERISQFEVINKIFTKYNILIKMIVLLEEGL